MAQTSAISLDDEQQAFVESLIRAGRYRGANDVVAMGLKLLQERERDAQDFIAGIETEIEAGLASGASAPMENAEDLLVRFRSSRAPR